jgi:hypothetical protein
VIVAPDLRAAKRVDHTMSAEPLIIERAAGRAVGPFVAAPQVAGVAAHIAASPAQRTGCGASQAVTGICRPTIAGPTSPSRAAVPRRSFRKAPAVTINAGAYHGLRGPL